MARGPASSRGPAGSSSGASRVFLRPGALVTTFGSPTLSHINKAPAWLLDAAANELLTGAIHVPHGWSTLDIDFWWTNAGAGAGNVVFRCDVAVFGDGTTLTDPATGSLTTVAAPAQNVVEVSTLRVAVTSPTADEQLTVEAMRMGADAADTLANDVGLLGVMLRKVS